MAKIFFMLCASLLDDFGIVLELNPCQAICETSDLPLGHYWPLTKNFSAMVDTAWSEKFFLKSPLLLPNNRPSERNATQCVLI